MTAIQQPRIVHESEAQRQHVRLPLPAKAEIGGHDYDVKDLSSGGVSIRGIEGNFQPGGVIKPRLKLPFGTFSFDINLSAEIRHYDTREKVLGCVFIDLAPEQISLINHVLRAFVSGDVVASADLLNVAARDNFVKERKLAAGTKAQQAELSFKRQLPGLAAVTMLGLLAAWFILGNVYQSLFVLKSADAVVTTPQLEIRAMSQGFYKNNLDPDTATVQPNQPIGTIGSGANASVQASPCDCYVVSQNAQDGQYIQNGDKIASLVPTSAKPWIVAAVDPAEASRLAPGVKADITVIGSKTEFSGHISSIESGMVSGNPAGGTESYAKPVYVKIIPDQRIPVSLANRPARVTFSVH